MSSIREPKPLLSVIVPVYKAEKYLRKCLDSITHQTYSNIEILIINDNSPDNSENIIFEYCKEHNNIKYIKNDDNCGVGYIRNIGAKNANGEYIAFIDSDDWIDLNYYERLMDALITDDSDIAVSPVITEYDNYSSARLRYKVPYKQVISSDFALRIMTKYYIQNFDISPNMNNRIYKKSIVVDNEVCSDFSRQAQDNYSSFMVFIYADTVSLVDNVYYHYYQREGSAVHTFSEKYINNYFAVLEHIKISLQNNNLFEQYKSEYTTFIDRSIKWLIQCMSESNNIDGNPKELTKLIINNCLNLFSLDYYIDYMDFERIKCFLSN